MPLRRLPVIPLLLALGACERTAPPAAPASAGRPPGCLVNLPAAPLIAPAASLQAQEFAATPLDASGLRCLDELLAGQPFATPQHYDPAYAPIQAAHGEDAALRWEKLRHERVQLLRISQGPSASAWLLRIDTGLALEGGRYDLLFTSDAQGRLREQLLVGADGVRYRRSMDLRSPNQFSLQESGGREAAPGADYRAAFQIDDEGHIALDPGGATAPLDAAAVNSSASDEPATSTGDESATSLEEVDGAPGDAEAIRQLLFSDSGVIEESVQRHDFADGSLGMLAIGRTGTAGLAIYVFRPAQPPAAVGRTRYQVASLAIAEPDGVVGAELGKVAWKPAATGVAITLTLRYDVLRPGGNPDSGEAETLTREQTLQLHYDATAGALRRVPDAVP
ncbi:hypothetical protein [Tahibacter harae]|uniref:Lipoprotein n=1 Tax=Tahibacter harae TaxID=2963937 RepID=A0ABT1QRX5_9GAMM|nr:hypothetical protein [Tahibacter harae]MCQ4165050.1 hypothetical protein [Tahibacter harae]